MPRLLSSVLAVLALAACAGCAGSARQAHVTDSSAAQIPMVRIAEAPPCEFEMELGAPRHASRINPDRELTGSLRADSPTQHTTAE